jgi:hypothetical protein
MIQRCLSHMTMGWSTLSLYPSFYYLGRIAQQSFYKNNQQEFLNSSSSRCLGKLNYQIEVFS